MSIENEKMVKELIEGGWLKTKRIINAFLKIKREDFVPEDLKHLAYLNEAFPIGYGQTISQPLVVAFMLEKLDPRPGEKILDIGAGSGWTSALLAEIVGEKGKIIAIEIIPELVEFGKKNVSKYNFIEKGRVKFICGDGTKGYVQEAPYDKILCSASAKEVPNAWKEQLRIGGKIITPIKNSIVELTKIDEKEFQTLEYPGFVFVPLISKE